MKIRSGYILRQVMDIYVVLGIGSEAYTPNQIMSVNETGAFLWGLLEKGAEKQELVESLTKEYDVDAVTAEKDVEEFLEQLRTKALIEE
jgi:hypothetical protein